MVATAVVSEASTIASREKPMNLYGIIPPMTTAFDENEDVDRDAVRSQVDWLVGAGAELTAFVSAAVPERGMRSIATICECSPKRLLMRSKTAFLSCAGSSSTPLARL